MLFPFSSVQLPYPFFFLIEYTDFLLLTKLVFLYFLVSCLIHRFFYVDNFFHLFSVDKSTVSTYLSTGFSLSIVYNLTVILINLHVIFVFFSIFSRKTIFLSILKKTDANKISFPFFSNLRNN